MVLLEKGKYMYPELLVGKYGLGERNKAGERLIEFCAGNDLNISNIIISSNTCEGYTHGYLQTSNTGTKLTI